MHYVQIDLFGKVGVGKTTIYNHFKGDRHMKHGGNLVEDWRVFYAKCWIFKERFKNYMVFLSDPKFDMRWRDLDVKFLEEKFEPTNIVMVVTDSTPEDVVAVKNSLKLLPKLKLGLITFVLANKQDLPDALSVSEIKERLSTNDVYGLSALSPDAKEILEEAFLEAKNRYLLMLSKRNEQLDLID